MSPLTRLHVALVTSVGCGLAAFLAVLVVTRSELAEEWTSQAFWMLAVLAVVGELVPFRVPYRHEAQEVTLSTTFVLAILFAFGFPCAVVVQAVGSILSDIYQRKVWWKAAFNVGQYTVSWGAAALVLTLVGGDAFGPSQSFGVASLSALVLAGAAFFLVNSTLIGVAIATATGVPVLGYLRRDFGFHASTAIVLSSLSPVVIVLANDQAWLVPLLLLPIAAVHKSARVSLEKEHQASHDGLTGLANRIAFREWIEDTLAEHPPTALDVLMIDLDSFREVNDTLGHELGDRLLCLIADRLVAQFADGMSVARLGGDEFALAVRTTESEDRSTLGARVAGALERPFPLEGLLLPITASVGVASFPRDGDTVDLLLQRAEVAMYLAKERQTSFEGYEPERDHHTTKRLSLLGELHTAIEKRQLVFHYQPVADIASGRITSAEALVRWEHPVYGLIPPDEFVPLAEPTGLIEPLTAFALESALRQCRTWLDAGYRVAVAVNVSVRNLYEDGFARKVGRLLMLCRVPTNMLTLEITEGTVMADPVRAAAALGELHAMGVKIAIDDFGTGYSSLVHLRRLPVDQIKIDRSFVMNMDRDDNDAAIVRSTIDLAHNLGLRVVAEGVESGYHLQRLAELGCDLAQGYFVARPALAASLDLHAAIRQSQPTEPARAVS